MKKELVSLLHFILIAGLAGYGWYGLMLLQGRTDLSLYSEFEHFLLLWIFSFVILSFIRLGIYYLYFRKKPEISAEASSRDFISREILRTIEYLILAVIAIPISFNLSIPNSPPHISINIFEMWRGAKEVYFAWLFGFFILILLRLGIIYLKNKRFEGQINL